MRVIDIMKCDAASDSPGDAGFGVQKVLTSFDFETRYLAASQEMP